MNACTSLFQSLRVAVFPLKWQLIVGRQKCLHTSLQLMVLHLFYVKAVERVVSLQCDGKGSEMEIYSFLVSLTLSNPV